MVHGVKKGSVKGALLSKIYINDLYSANFMGTHTTLANDAELFFTRENKMDCVKKSSDLD